MNLKKLIKIFSDIGCNNVYIKTLAPNDNSKNQVYLGASFEILNILPITEITSDNSGGWKETRFKTMLDFSWISEQGIISRAPDSKLILYPNYPEVRFSGFLKGCENPPSDLMTNRIDKRLLFLGVSDRKIIGFVTSPSSAISNEVNALNNLETEGVFRVLQIKKDSKSDLLRELKRIHNLGWIDSKRLDNTGKIMPCSSSHCGGYTLEAELGIKPNSLAEPDYLGWEIKSFKVSNLSKFQSGIVTLMTPEPTGGFYSENGVESFIRTFGYKDKKGRLDRMNFGGIHKVNSYHKTTGLNLILDGFDAVTGQIKNASGAIVLINKDDNVAASWSFTSLIKHWNQKHNKASYIPSKVNKAINPKQYAYGDQIILGQGTDFNLFLTQMALGNIYYDPGIKLENISVKPKPKSRSQFRVKSGFLPTLYKYNEVVDLKKVK